MLEPASSSESYGILLLKAHPTNPVEASEGGVYEI